MLFAVATAILLKNSSEKRSLISPWINGEKAAVNLWFPRVQAVFTEEKGPGVTAKAAYFVDADSGEVLYEKNSHARMSIASLTKIMTAIVALKHRRMDDKVLISRKAASMEPDRMILLEGETLTVEELMYGLFLVSANDAAEALAETSTDSREDFLRQMNETAMQIGMKDTNFINPTGLEEDDQKQLSTAYDVALMSRFAIKYFPKLVDISSTNHIVLPQTSTHQDYDLYSGINLLTTYPGVLGFKTGYTPEAGYTLVTLAKKGGHMVLGVLLDSAYRRDEARELLDYSFGKLGVTN